MKIIAVDFDGCLCRDNWPDIGEPNWEIIHALVKRQAEGDKVILWSCRCGAALTAAVMWCVNHGLKFDAINENLPENIEKYGNDCRKVFAHEYWDDKSVMTRAGDYPLMAWFQEDGTIRVRRWYKGTPYERYETLAQRIKRRWHKWRCG